MGVGRKRSGMVMRRHEHPLRDPFQLKFSELRGSISPRR